MSGRPWSALGILSCVAALWGDTASAFYQMDDLREMVQRADVIVLAKVIETHEPQDEETRQRLDERGTATLAVEKVLIGSCKRIIRVQYDSEWVFHTDYVVGGVYYLCLEKASDPQGRYREANDGLSKMRVTDGKVDISKVPIPEFVKPLLKSPTPQALERVICWLRGPELRVKLARTPFRCGQPLVFHVTLTNTSDLPMTLPLGTDDIGFNDHFDALLTDAHGFPLLIDAYCKVHPFELDDWPRAEATRTLAPGQSFSGTVRFNLLLSDFAQNPANAVTMSLGYRPWLREKHAPKRCWRGAAWIDVPIRIACPYRKWAAGLVRHDGQWAVLLGNGSPMNWQPLVALPRMGVEVAIGVVPRPAGKLEWWGIEQGGLWPEEVDARTRRAIAACFRIERNGRFLPAPKPDEPAVRRWLARVRKGELEATLTVDLAKHFPFDHPGAYRVRLVLPGAKRPSLSNVLKVIVPGEAAKP